MIDEKHHKRLDNPVQRLGGQLREPRVGEDDVCGDPDQIREQDTKQSETANDVDEVDTFLCGDRVRSLTNGWREVMTNDPAASPGLERASRRGFYSTPDVEQVTEGRH